MGRFAAALAAGVATALLAGCAAPPPPPPPPPQARETYMVMPEDGGRVGVLTVTLKDGRQQVLEGEYRAMRVQGDAQQTFVGDRAQLESLFGEAVTALPKPPMNLSLFFVRGKDELTAESRAAAEQAYRDFLERQSQEVWIVGHTDTVGSERFNEALSLKRAERVRQMLIKLGIPAENIVAKGKGKRDLLVRTPDNTDEPRNRRVDISVR